MTIGTTLPIGWITAQLGDLAWINPRSFTAEVGPNDEVSFVPMAAVEAGSGVVDASDVRPWGELSGKSYTRFGEGDLLFAKITPCMENGKFAIARGLKNRAGVGSTEFHVIRCPSEIDSKYLLYFLLQEAVRGRARRVMSGAVGQMRVPVEFLTGLYISVAPQREQHGIVAEIEKHVTRLDASVAALKRAQAKLKRYRAAVLKAAVEGRLVPTEAELARAEGRDYEPADMLLDRILNERQARWEAAELAKMRARGRGPRDDRWKAAYKAPQSPNPEGLTGLPTGWAWATVDQITLRSEYGTSARCSYEASNIPVLRIPNIVAGKIDLDDLKFAVEELSIDDSDALTAGDILVCRTNGSISLIGKAAVVPPGLDAPHYFASYLLRFRLVESEILPRWFHAVISSEYGRRFIERRAASSAGQHNISLGLLHSMVMPVPPLSEQQRIMTEVEERLSVADNLAQSVANSGTRGQRLRQSILRLAFEGRLVPQDPDDEPASVLLERIHTERARKPSNGRHHRRSRSAEAAAAQMRLDEVAR